MLSYQHGYHAGSFADVVKHLALSRILRYMCHKEKPIFYLDTHAGKGLYDLKSPETLKTGEASQGIEQVWANQAQLSDLFSPFLDVIRAHNPDGVLRYYPGSPVFALHQLREHDRLYCCERHPREFEVLQHIPSTYSKMKIHLSHADGLKKLSALLPPPEHRGVVFIDPSYEIKTDYQLIPYEVNTALRRFGHGVYCIWYPIVNRQRHNALLTELSKMSQPHCRVEFYYTHAADVGMTGCGLWIINPPYVLAEELNMALSILVTVLNPGVSSYAIVKTP